MLRIMSQFTQDSSLYARPVRTRLPGVEQVEEIEIDEIEILCEDSVEACLDLIRSFGAAR